MTSVKRISETLELISHLSFRLRILILHSRRMGFPIFEHVWNASSVPALQCSFSDESTGATVKPNTFNSLQQRENKL